MTSVTEVHFEMPSGLRLVGDVSGPFDAPAVILLHGGGQTRHSWSRAMHRLAAQGYRVVSYDARGHGDSDWAPDGDYSLPAMAADLKSVRATLNGPVALVGASMGGLTSFLAVGSSTPSMADALVMVDVALRPAQEGVQNIARFMRAAPNGFATLEEAARSVTAYNPGRPRPSNPETLMRNLREGKDGRLRWHWDPRFLDTIPSNEPPSRSNSVIEVSQNVRVPVLLVQGEHSDIVDAEAIAEMRHLVPQTEVVQVPGAGHMVAGDRNDAFASAVIAFLERNFAA